ncbi:MAG: EamA family transporter [Rhodospirillales bacterium]|nr:EamA family transporter [Alphaproteobacteria bacterium]MCB9981378.1 EamA family transporter [Rhodospirillales bacterium]
MNTRDIALAIFVMAIWGMHYVVIRIGALEIPPFLLLTLRFGLCSLLFAPFASRINLEQLKNIALYALPFQGIHMGLLFAGLAQVDSSIAALIMKTGMPFSILLGWIFYHERFGLKTFAGLAIALLGGCIFLYNPAPGSNITVIGVTFLIFSAFFWALGSVRLKAISELDFPTMVFYAFTIPLPLAVCTSLLLEDNQIQLLQNANHIKLAWVLAYQVLLVSFAHYLWKVLIARNPVYVIAPFSLLTPIFGVTFGVIIMGEQFSTTMLIGAIIAMTGIAIVTFRKARRTKKIKNEKQALNEI